MLGQPFSAKTICGGENYFPDKKYCRLLVYHILRMIGAICKYGMRLFTTRLEKWAGEFSVEEKENGREFLAKKKEVLF